MTAASPTRSRMHSLDYLRGVAALGILAYHYHLWTVGGLGAGHPLGRVGIYGVSVFYVLSGLTMHQAYARRMTAARSPGELGRRLRVFAVRRVFRILPLLWLATLLTLWLSTRPTTATEIVLNLTGLFGFVAWDDYIATGAWSIGNELVFYALFPLMVLAARGGRWALAGTGAVLAVPYLVIAFTLDDSAGLGATWSTYVNPLNQALLFFGGLVIGHVLTGRAVRQARVWAVLGLCLLLFVLWPVSGAIDLLYLGPERVVFTLVCLLGCAAVFLLRVQPPRWLHVALSGIGAMSYSIYLLHPIAHDAVERVVGARLGPWPVTAIAVVVTFVVSAVVYRLVERPLTNLGRTVTTPRPAPTAVPV